MLADFLEGHNFSGRGFDFSKWVTGASKHNPCGTAGCAIGWMPELDEDWHYLQSGENNSDPVYKDFTDPKSSAKAYFEIDDAQFYHLFMPDRQDTYLFSGKTLDYAVMPSDVAYNIREFIREMS